MCRKNVFSNRNLFVAISLLLMIGYVGYLFAGSPNAPFPTNSNNAADKPGSYNDNGTTVNVRAYVAYNYVWDHIDEQYEIRTYHFARLWGLPAEAQDFTVEFRHRPFDPGFHPDSDEGIPFWDDHVNDGEHGDQDRDDESVWERDNTYTSYRDGDGAFEWDDLYTAIRFDGTTRARAARDFWLPAAP